MNDDQFPEAPSTGHAASDQDAALMALVKTGDIAAFERLVETHQLRIIRTVAKMLGDETDPHLEIRAALSIDREIHDVAIHHHAESRLQRNAPT